MAFTGTKFNSDLRVKGNIFSEESSYQQPILDIQTDNTLDPGASPAKGDRYILTDTGNLNANFGTITGVGNGDIVEYDGSDFLIAWDASAQGEGAQVYDKDSSVAYLFNGSAWVQASGTVQTSSPIEGDGSVGSPISLADTAVSAGSYGDAQSVPSFTVDAQGRLTAAADVTIDDNTKIPLSQRGANDGVATLDVNGKVPTTQLPALAITDVFTVADITARDALTVGAGDGEVQEGDVAIVTDASGDAAIASGTASYIYNGSGWSRLQEGVAIGNRSGALTDPFTASLTRTFTHNWNTLDVQAEAIDSVTGETCFVELSRTVNTVVITVNQEPINPLRILLREISGSQTTLVAS